jgi:PIN domain nuclease of toxin-antitoxin system
MIYVIDTHSLIWFLTGDKNLGKNALKILEDADKGVHIIIIPTIVLAELMYICENKGINMKFIDILNKLKNSLNYIPYNLDINLIIKASTLNKIKEIHDRLIIAITQLTDAKLITKDKLIKNTSYVECVW